MTKGWTWGLVLSGLLGAQLAWADLPTHEEVWRDDDRGVVVYKDNLDADTYWYLPQIKLFTENGRLNPHRRELSNGNVQYTFDLVPYLSEDVVKDLTYRIPGLYRRDQLKPIYAKKFALQIKDYDVLASSQEVTNYAYLNKPQRVRLSLNADQDADFRDLFTSNPGVPVNIAIYYKSENVDKYLKVELTYKEVYRAMTIGGSAGLTFTKAQIAHNVSNYLSNKYLNITSKGAVQIPDIIETVLHECFTPVAGPNSGNSGCGSYNNANNGCFGNNGNYGNGGNYGNYGNNGTGGNIPGAGNLPPDNGNNDYLVASDDSEVKIDAAGRKLLAGLTQRAGSGLPAASPSSSLTGGDVMAWLGANASAEFQYKKELANNDTNFLYKQVQMADSQEVWVTTAYLSESPQPEATETVTALGSQNLIVEYDASAMAPFHTGVTISAGDEYTLNASFTLAGQAPDIKGTSYFRWDPSWGSIDGDLYFRVGTGPWRKVNGRSSITDDSLHTGELQFYVDRTAIWNKLPAELRLPKHKFWAPILAFDKTYPTFQVQLSGRHIERR